jgi:hypothetical protein
MSREIEVWADWRELGAPMRMTMTISSGLKGSSIGSGSS